MKRGIIWACGLGLAVVVAALGVGKVRTVLSNARLEQETKRITEPQVYKAKPPKPLAQLTQV